MRKSALAWGTVLLVVLAGGRSHPALAKDGGFRIEAGPDISFSRYSDGSTQGWSAGAYLGMDAWSSPFGVVFQARKGTRVSDVAFTDGVLTSTMTLTSQVDVAPSFNITPGPLHLRVAVGPWFAHSEERTESLSDADLAGYWGDWSGLEFMGAMTEVRLDANLPVLSPFAVLAVHSRHTVSVFGQTYGAEPGDYTGRDVRATVGVRLNVVPIVKLSVAGFTGQSQHVLQTSLTTGTQSWEVLGQSYGLSIWATVKL